MNHDVSSSFFSSGVHCTLFTYPLRTLDAELGTYAEALGGSPSI